MPSGGLLLQALSSGLFLGALYGLIGLGLGLGWGLLRQINLAHFAWVFLSAYLTYELKARFQLDPLVALLILLPSFGAVGMALQALLSRFQISPFNSLLVTFGITVTIEAVIQFFWTADYRRMNTIYEEHKINVGPIYATYGELITVFISCALIGLAWWILNRTDLGKALRASSEDPDIATAFGINARQLGIYLNGVCAALAAAAGVCIALLFTLAPSEIYAWVGVIFAAVMIGRLGSAITPLLGGLLIGAVEAMTMALFDPAWAPMVAFAVLIIILIFRRGDE
jgi:branched-chain amino acid transport system permease protein